MSLLFNTLSRFVIAFLPRSKCFLISWLQSPSTVILEPMKIKSVTASTFSPFICHEVMRLDAMILIFHFFMWSFKPAFSLSSFKETLSFLKRLFNSSSRSAIRVVSYAYLKLLLFLPTTLIPASDCISHVGHYVSVKQALWHYTALLYSLLNFEPVFPCPVLTAASWPTYRFLRRQVRWSG